MHELAVKMEGKTQESYNSFTRSLSDDFPAYPDFVSPVTDSINQVSESFMIFLVVRDNYRLRSSLLPSMVIFRFVLA